MIVGATNNHPKGLKKDPLVIKNLAQELLALLDQQ